MGKKLREIERGTYSATQFLNDLKQMVQQVVVNGRNTSYRILTIEEQNRIEKKKSPLYLVVREKKVTPKRRSPRRR